MLDPNEWNTEMNIDLVNTKINMQAVTGNGEYDRSWSLSLIWLLKINIISKRMGNYKDTRFIVTPN